jgi:hypothetical protein
LKTLELRARRDAFVVFFLGFFTMLTNFFFSQALPVAASMLVGLLGLLTALVNAHMPVGKPPLAEAARTAGWMALLGAPIMAVLFVLFPRFAPLWGIPNDAMSGRSGLSHRCRWATWPRSRWTKHRAARQVRRHAAAAERPYFRGPVLSEFDGREWRPLQPRLARASAASATRSSSRPAARSRYESRWSRTTGPGCCAGRRPQPPEAPGWSGDDERAAVVSHPAGGRPAALPGRKPRRIPPRPATRAGCCRNTPACRRASIRAPLQLAVRTMQRHAAGGAARRRWCWPR